MTRVPCILALFLGLLVSDVPADEPTLVSLIHAWKTREAAIGSARIEWACRRFRSAELTSLLHDTTPHARANARFSQSNILVFDGTKMRFEYRRDGGAVYVSVFDNEVARALMSDPALSSYGVGTIYRRTEHVDIDMVPLVPIMFACRPFGYGNAGVAFAPETLHRSLVGDDVVQGRRIVKLRRQDRERLFEAFLDASCRFRLSRFTIYRRGHVAWRCNVQYPTDLAEIPTAWLAERLTPTGQLLSAYDCNVTSVSINPEIPSDMFALEFPLGTHVHDQRSDRNFVVRDTGLREVLPHERRLSHDVLMTSETGEPPQATAGLRMRAVYVVGVVIGVVLVALASLRHHFW